MRLSLKGAIVSTIAALLLIASAVWLSGCQWDSQVNNSVRFLMDGEGAESREVWAFGNLK